MRPPHQGQGGEPKGKTLRGGTAEGTGSRGAGRFCEALPDEIPSTREKRYLQTGQRVWRLRMRRAGA